MGEQFVVVFGGCAVSQEGEDVLLDDLYLLELQGPAAVRCGRQDAAGPTPAPRLGALLHQHHSGKLLLYGGTGAGGKQLGDAWLLDLASLTWECVYDGLPQVSRAAFCGGLSSSAMHQHCTFTPLLLVHAGKCLCSAWRAAGVPGIGPGQQPPRRGTQH
jgi:hypothetical protein